MNTNLFFEPDNKNFISVCGCGGKTSLIGVLAELNRNKKVLITPTTKIRPMHADHIRLCTDLDACLAHEPAIGIQCMGILNPDTHKLCALPEADLRTIAPQYDIVLMEADGSRGLPCKGWNDSDPVIPDFTTHTIGLVSIHALGLHADEESVYRLPEFLATTGLREHEKITLHALACMIASPQGMFHRHKGEVILLINQVEDAQDIRNAALLTDLILQMSPCPIRIITGSVAQNKFRQSS